MDADPRFELKKVTTSEWLILDSKYASGDLRRTIACIYEMSPVEVEVMWLRNIPLARCYNSAFDALEDVHRFYAPRRRIREAPIPAQGLDSAVA